MSVSFRVAATLSSVVVTVLILIATAENAGAAPIILAADATYAPGGASSPDVFSINNYSDAGVQLAQIIITSNTGVLFDPVSTDTVITTGGLATSFAFSDSDTVLTINFSGFDTGETFSFTADVDRTNNENVNANQFEDSMIEFVFSGPFVGSPVSVDEDFGKVGNVAIANGTGMADMLPMMPDPPTAAPEPASLAVWLVLGLCGFGWLRRHSRARLAA